MQEKFCKDCVHFLQHYFKFNDNYIEVECGHCIFPRIKSRCPESTACTNYETK